jgi:hypothetical protein
MYDYYAQYVPYCIWCWDPYYQQQADYKIDIELMIKKQYWVKQTVHITITHQTAWSIMDTIRSKSKRRRFWISLAKAINEPDLSSFNFCEQIFRKGLDRGFNLEYVKMLMVMPTIYSNHTRWESIWLPWGKFNNLIFYQMVVQHQWLSKDGGRSGYEFFEKEGNRLYVIAQFYPRMAVYNVEGWQNMQFWGSGEFALPFGILT